MELLIILFPIVIFIIGIDEIKYRIKIKKDAIYYRDLDRELEKMKLKEEKLILQEKQQIAYREEQKKKEEEKIKNNPHEELLIRIAILSILICILFFALT